MASTADDFQLRFEVNAGKQNPIQQFILLRTDDIAVSSTVVELMNAKADPRRASYFTPAPFSPTALTTPPSGTTGYVGLPNGTGANQVRNNLSGLHSYVRGAVTNAALPAGPLLTVNGAGTSLNYDGSVPIRVLLFSEYNFIRAELALRYGAPGDADSFFQNGVRASFSNAGQTAAQATTCLTAQGTLGTGEAALKKRIEEKYVANYMVAVEPWNDRRRTDYPALSKIRLPSTPATVAGCRAPCRIRNRKQTPTPTSPSVSPSANGPSSGACARRGHRSW